MPDLVGVSAQGTKVYRSIDPDWPPGAPRGGVVDFVQIANLGNTSGPETRCNEIDLSNHNVDAEEIFPGILRYGSGLQMNRNWLGHLTTHAALQDDIDNNYRNIWKVEVPDNPGGVGSAVIFSGFVTSIGQTMPVDDKLSADVVIRPTGRRLVVPATPTP